MYRTMPTYILPNQLSGRHPPVAMVRATAMGTSCEKSWWEDPKTAYHYAAVQRGNCSSGYEGVAWGDVMMEKVIPC